MKKYWQTSGQMAEVARGDGTEPDQHWVRWDAHQSRCEQAVIEERERIISLLSGPGNEWGIVHQDYGRFLADPEVRKFIEP